MKRKPTNSLEQVARSLEAEPEQSLVFERFLPAQEVTDLCERLGHNFRDGIYTPVVTIWMFLGQTLSADHSCRDAVHRLNAWRVGRVACRTRKEEGMFEHDIVQSSETTFVRTSIRNTGRNERPEMHRTGWLAMAMERAMRQGGRWSYVDNV